MGQNEGALWTPGVSSAKDINPSEYEPVELLRSLGKHIDQIDLIVGDMRMNHGNSINNLRREFVVLTGRLNTLESRMKAVERAVGIEPEPSFGERSEETEGE